MELSTKRMTLRKKINEIKEVLKRGDYRMTVSKPTMPKVRSYNYFDAVQSIQVTKFNIQSNHAF